MFKLIYPTFWQHKGILSYLLWPLSQLYSLLGSARRLIAKPIRFNAKVICVGNITVGGTGKTQIVIWLSKLLQEKKVKFVIVTKAYNGSIRDAVLVDQNHKAYEVGDESILLAKYGQVIAAKKVQQIKNLVDQLNPEVIIFDDGMQNPNFHKDFNILVMDGTRDLGNEFLIPAGPLRQSLSQGLKLSDIVIAFDKSKMCQFNTQLFNNIKPIFAANTIPVKQNNLNIELNYFAFCSIGNPGKFFNTLAGIGVKTVGSKIFSDHYCYKPYDLEILKVEAKKLNAVLITTTKDHVKIPQEYLKYIISLETQLVIDNENVLKSFIHEKIIH